MKRELVETSRFGRAVRKFTLRNTQRQKCVEEALSQMESDVFDPRLKTHALSGHLAGRYACSCGYDCRIVFKLVKDEKTNAEFILLVDVGTHNEVY